MWLVEHSNVLLNSRILWNAFDAPIKSIRLSRVGNELWELSVLWNVFNVKRQRQRQLWAFILALQRISFRDGFGRETFNHPWGGVEFMCCKRDMLALLSSKMLYSLTQITFLFRRSLKCARITLHMNLFASFAANNFLWLIWYHVILDTNILEGQEQVSDGALNTSNPFDTHNLTVTEA